ncbi:MAG TPA: FG-GAP-like repeat-containing protein [Kofleriaceae bacterium]|nr:FG-GAP-like repeat-containing protein [Kofleriaceae bacterium]
MGRSWILCVLVGCGAEAAPAPPPERAPDPPRAIGPAQSASLVIRPRFVWAPSAGADRYELEVAACRGGVDTCAWTPALAHASITETSWVPAIDLRGRIAWRVRACAGACSPWSRARWLDAGRAPIDLDGDGFSDAIAGAPLADLGGKDRGAVVIAKGPALTAARLDEPAGADGAEFGAALAAGDIDADGKDELVVGAPGHNDGAGRAYVYTGGAAQPMLALADPEGASGDAFGAAILVADFDDDGYADLAIAAPGAEAGGIRDAGRVLVWRGSAGGAIGPPRVVAAPSPEAFDRFGTALAAGDLDGDGYPDLVVGAPGLDRAGARRGTDRGAVYVYRGSDDGLLNFATRLEAPVPLDHDRFGFAIAAGDLDDDGTDELLVGAPSSEAGASQDGGLVYVFTRGARTPEKILQVGDAAYQRFGSAIAIAGDVDGDGFPDVVIGTSAPDRGLAFVYRGGREGVAAQPLALLQDPSSTAADDFGDSVAGTGDVDGDGLADVLIGAASARRDGERQGSILVYRGARRTFSRPLRVDGPAEQAHFGRSLAGR